MWRLTVTGIELALAMVQSAPKDLVVLRARRRETLAMVGRRVGVLPTWERA